VSSGSVTLLALLAANDKMGAAEVHRTVLMKQAFLAETIRPLYRYWTQSFEFIRYYYGPYSDEIFYCLDTLIFNGLVDVTKAVRTSGRLEARYRIRREGHDALARIPAREIVSFTTDLVWALQALGIDQASTICRLVYQEAEFARVLAHSAASNIGPEAKIKLPAITAAHNETFAALATLESLFEQRVNTTGNNLVPSREVVRVFLSSLVTEFQSSSRRQ
jgi:DNA-binding PadR family transcriptional regulator